MRIHSVGGRVRQVHRNSSVLVLALGMSVYGLSGALAQTSGETVLEDIVVEGVTLSGEGVAADRQGSSLTVVTGEELEAQQIRNAADALRSLPGVSVSRSGGFSGLTQVRLRGAEGNHTLVLIDGVEVNDTTTGEFDFSSLSTDQIERIEIIRGAQSGIWGSNALGGVINIVTRKGSGPVSLQIRGEAGSFSTVGGGVTMSGGNKVFHGSISYHARRSEGFNVAQRGGENEGSDRRTFAFTGGVNITDALSVNVVLRNMRKSGGRDTEGGAAGTLAVQTDNPSFFSSDHWVMGAEAKLALLDGKWQHKFKAQRNSVVTGDTSISTFGTSLSENEGVNEKFTYLSTLQVDTPTFAHSRHFLTGLVELEKEAFTPTRFAGQFFSGDGVEHRREHTGYVAEYRGEYFDKLFVTANVRYDDNDSFDDQTTWRTTGAYKLSNVETSQIGIRLHGSAGTAVKNPSLFEQFGFIQSIFTPNPDLKPEESLGWDAGVAFKLLAGKYVFDVTYFEADLTNKIATRFLPNFTSTAVNLPGTSERRGVELSARMQLSPDLSLRGAYTWLDATDPDGLPEIRRTKNTGRVDLNYVFGQGRGKLHAAAVYNGRAADIAFRLPFFAVERVTLDDYWLVSLAGSYEVQKGVEFFGRVENLLDQNYQEIFGFSTAGVSAYAGIKVKFTADDPVE